MNPLCFFSLVPGGTAIHYAARRGKLEAIKILLDNHCTNAINLPDRDSKTALYHACFNRHVECAQELLRVSLGGGHYTSHNKTLDLALEIGNSNVLKTMFLAIEGLGVGHEHFCFLHQDQLGHSVLFKAMTRHWQGIIKDILAHEKDW